MGRLVWAEAHLLMIVLILLDGRRMAQIRASDYSVLL